MSEQRRKTGELAATLLLAGAVIALEWGWREQIQPDSFDPTGSQTTSNNIGKGARSPADIPARGWWQIIKRTITQVSNNELISEAASVTFYGLLAIFPALAAMVSIYGLVADPKTIAGHLATLSSVIPGGGMDIISDQVKRLTENPSRKLGIGAVVGVATAIWSANQGSKALFSALNVVHGEKERRGFIKLTAQSLTFTMGALVFILLALVTVVLVPLLLASLGLKGNFDQLIASGRWPVIVVVTALFLACLYRFGPSRAEPQWRWVTWGSAFAAIAWATLSAGFSWYVEHFGSYNKTYGSLGAVIGFMTWIWLSTTVILVGAQLNAEAKFQTARDTSTGPERPRGQRGAVKADQVA